MKIPLLVGRGIFILWISTIYYRTKERIGFLYQSDAR